MKRCWMSSSVKKQEIKSLGKLSTKQSKSIHVLIMESILISPIYNRIEKKEYKQNLDIKLKK